VTPVVRRRWRLALASTLTALLLAEVIARAVLAAWNAQPPPKPPQGEVLLVQMLQPSPHPDVVYELQPRLDCVFRGVPVATNSHGWRGPELDATRAERPFRVLCLGDSVLFGWGVPWPDTGVARLQERLRAALPAHRVDVIGTGVPGYNTVMQAALLRAHSALAPDVVLLDIVDNDLDLPNFLLAPASFWRVDHCYLLDLARRVWRSRWLDPRNRFEWAPIDASGRFVADPALAPAAYRYLVGADACRRALASIRELGAQRGFRVLVTSHHGLGEPFAGFCRELGLPVVEVRTAIEAHLRANGPAAAAALRVAADDPHPSALVHGFWADATAARLAELGWLPR
jgi:lysophospholipase L1-like esterase